MSVRQRVRDRLPVLSVGRSVRFRHLRHAVAATTPTSILDAGCGDGQLTRWLCRRFPQARVLGIDSGADEVRDTTRRLKGHHNAEVKLTSVGGAPLNRRFDLVVCTDVLEHLIDDERGLTWLVQHVAPNGFLVLHVPALDQPHPLRLVDSRMRAEVDAAEGPHFREGYGASDLAARVQRLGLDILEASSTFHSPALWWAVDIDQWVHFTNRRAIKICARPLLLCVAAIERSPGHGCRGHGVLLVGQRASSPSGVMQEPASVPASLHT